MASHANLPAGGAQLAATIDRATRRATLRPLLAARDADLVVEGQLRLLGQEGVDRVVVLLDLGRATDGVFAPALLRHGLVPRALIPDAAGDLLLERTRPPAT
ncbi:hypothetical protein STVA_20100 [Allostella vacuolata]|nr:hypothetical protein STVA_20100 [Stella vacuolata]